MSENPNIQLKEITENPSTINNHELINNDEDDEPDFIIPILRREISTIYYPNNVNTNKT